ncbi:stage V sporulation protein AD [Alloiococcus sp. CFN-8]|uniref:stage V sporulation protein AD n=1 Tax=Alloiococcus sp. CFN-8 TaxID=3416081 RepID=UPI003CF7F945
MLQGKQSWIFQNSPKIISTGVVGGPFEAKGPLASDFDKLYDDIWIGEKTYEKAEKKLLEDACEIALEKGKFKKEDITFLLTGDLMNQIISSSFCARTLGIPHLGLFGACSSSMESLSLAAQLIDSGAAKYALAGATSHNVSVEKQFRYPTEYGSQKPPTSQWTVTGSGASIISLEGNGPRVTSATIGRVVDMGITDPFNMGAAMAPAAADTIIAHFNDLDRTPDYYDIIATGDLGIIGHRIASDLLKDSNLQIPPSIFTDCGLLIYNEDQPVQAGASGCGCSAIVTYGHFINRMKKGELRKILIVATGALLSQLSFQQKESIPCIAHAVSIEI